MRHDSEYTDQDFKDLMADEFRKNISVDDLFAELEAHAWGRCFGNVHHFNLRQLVSNLRSTPSNRDILVFDLVRHPVSVVNSGTHNMIRQANHNLMRITES
jgi:hypothetical protein